MHKLYSAVLRILPVFLWLLLHQAVLAVAPEMPIEQYHACSSAGNSVRIEWNDVNGAEKYWFRLDANPRTWDASCGNPGDLCSTVTDSEITLEITPEVQYDWWVHSVNSKGEYSKGMDGRDIICTIPRPYNIYTRCDAQNTQLYMNWSSTFGRKPEKFEIRLDANPGTDETDTWTNDCNNLQDGDICASSTENNISINIQPGVQYRMWMHSVSGNTWTDGIGDRRILCGNIPTPTATPSPTSTPTPTITLTPMLEATGVPPTIEPSPTPKDIGITPRVVELCPRRPQGDADCNNVIDARDYQCWKAGFLGITLETQAACVHSDFDSIGGTMLLDYAIWYVNYLRAG